MSQLKSQKTKYFLAKTPFGNNVECQHSICYNNNDEKTDQDHYPLLANIHNNFLEINIDKNQYQPFFYTKIFKKKQKQN